MARLTITLPDSTHERLRYRAARENKSIGQVIEAELEAADDARRERIRAIMAKAQSHAENAPPMTEEELLELGVKLTHQVREEMAAEQASDCS